MTNGYEGINPLVIHGKMLNGEDDQAYKGITKREYFAAMAMQGLLVNYTNNNDSVNDGWPYVSEKAIVCADALINELNKTETK